MAYSVTPYETGGTAGTKVGEGKILQFTESDLTHPSHTDGFVDKGDVVLSGKIPGVALASASAATDEIAVEVGGIYNLSVTRADETGNIAIAIGDPIFADSACALSKKNSGTLIGYSLVSYAVGDGSAVVIPVRLLGGLGRTNRFFTHTMQFAAADVAKTVFVAGLPCKLVKVNARWGTKAGQAGTLTLEKCNTGEAAAAGDVMLAAALDLTGDNNVPVEAVAVADGKEVMVEGDAIRFKVASGAATSLADACITLLLELV